ncbi:50S ribosomal protein L15 [Marisediminicola antarctica]|uniref:50S ribosomal protein L15 n=1 Tax=Marisediminicola antarctica TaxID=674079 RepID=UPI00137A27D8|nr:50S ribosomal protein L15 [Marisediminicola antarctica]
MAEETTPAAKKAPAKAPAKATADKAAAPKAAAKKPTTAKADTAAPAAKKPAAKKPASAQSDAAEGATASSTVSAKSAPAKKKAAPAAEVAARPQVLKMHHLRPAPGAKKDRMRVGRGEGSKGKTAGRGTKGTKARYTMRPGFEGGNINFIMRAPKLRGFKNPFRVEYQVVNLEKLAELYPSGGEVTILDLVAKGAVRKNEKVKILGSGDIAVKLEVAVDKVSGSAEQKIVAAGGSVK